MEDSIEEEEEEELEESSGNLSASLAGIGSTSGDPLAFTAHRLKQKRDDGDESSETDLELEEEKPDFDVTGRATYLSVCRKFGLIPVSYFLRNMTEQHISLAHHGLGAKGMKALSYPLMKNTYILSLDLEDNWLEGEGGEYIAEMLNENCYITDLNVANNKLGSRGCEAICRVLQTNVTLKYINLSSNELCDKDAEYLATAFYENNRLQTVVLSRNNFGQTTSTALADAIAENETIEQIDLSWNNFRLKSAVSLCHGLATNSRLRVVNLAMNGLGNEGAFGIAEILKQSGTITSVDVSQNRIASVGATVIGKALETNDLLKILKIGHNPLGLDGIKTLLNSITSESSCVSNLDLSGIEIDKEFRAMKEELQESRNIQIDHGPVLSDYVIVGKPKKKSGKFLGTPLDEVTTVNIMVVIKAYCDNNGLPVYDTMALHDKTKDRKLVKADFLAALTDVGVELSSNDADLLDNLLVDYKTSDGKIDYSALR